MYYITGKKHENTTVVVHQTCILSVELVDPREQCSQPDTAASTHCLNVGFHPPEGSQVTEDICLQLTDMTLLSWQTYTFLEWLLEAS